MEKKSMEYVITLIRTGGGKAAVRAVLLLGTSYS